MKFNLNNFSKKIKPKKKKSSKRDDFVNNILIAFLVLFLISAIFSLFNVENKKVESISLSQLAEEINEGKVKSIVVEENNLTVLLKDGEIKQKTQKEREASLSETLTNYGVSPEKLREVDVVVKEPSGFVFWLKILLPFLLPFFLIGIFIWLMAKQFQRGSAQAFTFTKSRARMFTGEKVSFKDVAGLREAKEELKEVVDFLKHPKKFLDMGAKIPRGVLLIGPPGTGKTLLARAVAGEAGVPFFHIAGSEFVELFVGVGAGRVRDTFALAKKNAPAILFIDEIDAIGRQRGAGLGGGNDEREQTLNQILVEMDGFERDTNVIVMAATNRPDVLDPALLRPGRFDRRITLDEPDIKEREEILKIHAKDKPIAEDVDLKVIAARTPGFSGADLANVMNEAAILAARRNEKQIYQQDLIEAVEKVMLGPERKSHVLSEREKRITAFHEGGHALVAHELGGDEYVHKISIVSRGRAGGYTLRLPMEEKKLKTKQDFLDDIAVMLGGYTAEEIIFGDVTTGASNDLQKATHLARALITQFGMSDKFGPITFGHKEDVIFLGRELYEGREYSEETASEIDKEVERLLDEQHKRVKDIISKNRNKLNKIAERLIEKETIEKEEFEELMKQVESGKSE